jgi:hypothetical protein
LPTSVDAADGECFSGHMALVASNRPVNRTSSTRVKQSANDI